MTLQKYEYQFPEKSVLRAMEVTEPEFDILSREDWREQLYVDFSPVRSRKRFERMKKRLGVQQDKLVALPNGFTKIIFSGHRGSGKSTELQRFTREIDHPEAYLALYIDLQEEISIRRMEPEDLFVIMVSVFLRELEKRQIHIDQTDFDEIAAEWMQETELAKEMTKEYGFEAEGSVSVGWSFWKLLGVEGKLKGVLGQSNTTTQIIREKVKKNQKALVDKFSNALIDFRKRAIEYYQQKIGQDVVFIIDGLEKARPEVYENLFIRDTHLIQNIQAHIICCVPIQTFYEIQHQPITTLFANVYLPMLRVNEQSRIYLRELITRRVDPSLFNEEVLDLLIDYSGGCPRQLLHIVNNSLFNTLEEIVSKETALETIQELGVERWRGLTKRHKEVLTSGEYEDADKELLELLFYLNLLEYNGSNPERHINPLIQPYFESS